MPESSLRKILAVLRARWWLVVGLAVPVLLVGAWYAATRPPAYSSQAVVTFTPEAAASPDVSFVRLIPRYVVAATAPDALQAAADAAGMPEAALRDAVTVVNPAGTLELTVTAISTSPEASRSVVTVLADRVVGATQSDPLVGARVVLGATEPHDTTRLRQIAALGAGVVLGPLPGIALAFALEGARPRTRVREDVVALGVDVLAVVHRGALSGESRLNRSRRGDRDQLSRLALDVGGASEGGRRTVVVTSPASSEAEAVTRLVTAISVPTPRPAPGPGTAEGGTTPTLVASSGLLDDHETREAVRRSGRCVLVLRSGGAVEGAQDCLTVVDQLGAWLVGVVLLR